MLLSKERRIRATLIKENADATELVDVDVVGLANDGNTVLFCTGTQKAERYSACDRIKRRMTDAEKKRYMRSDANRRVMESLSESPYSPTWSWLEALREAIRTAYGEQEAGVHAEKVRKKQIARFQKGRVIRLRDEEGQ